MLVLRRHDDMRVKILTHLSKLKDNVINYYCNKKKKRFKVYSYVRNVPTRVFTFNDTYLNYLNPY